MFQILFPVSVCLILLDFDLSGRSPFRSAKIKQVWFCSRLLVALSAATFTFKHVININQPYNYSSIIYNFCFDFECSDPLSTNTVLLGQLNSMTWQTQPYCSANSAAWLGQFNRMLWSMQPYCLFHSTPWNILFYAVVYSFLRRENDSPPPSLRAQHSPRLCGGPVWHLVIPQACQPFAL